MSTPLGSHITAVADEARADRGRTALVFDIDGVLAPIVPNAQNARVPPDVLALLGELTARYLLVGVISGRGIADVERMVPVPGIARGGNHGLEVAEAGHHAHMVPEAAGAVGALRRFVAGLTPEVLAPRGAWMEDKGASVSLHFREAPDPGATRRWLRDVVRPAAIAAGLRTGDGEMILELLPDVDVDKGTALRALVTGAGARRVLYVGDDHTDADAWRAMRAMSAGGEIHAAHCVLADRPGVDPSVRAAADMAVAATEGVIALMARLAA